MQLTTKTLVIVAALAVAGFFLWRRFAPTTTAAAGINRQFTGPPLVPSQRTPVLSTPQPATRGGGSFFAKLQSAASATASAGLTAAQTKAVSYFVR